MFIFNFSLKKSKLSKSIIYIFLTLVILALIYCIFSFTNKSKKFNVTDCINNSDSCEITPNNYTNILEDSYNNIDDYVGKKIKFTGFVYRLYDFENNEFVLAREMIESQDSQNQAHVVVVGFLCNYNNASSYPDGSWVEVEGTIEKGFYHSEIPVVKVTNMTKVDCPENPYVKK